MRRVLVATDGSPGGDAAVRTGVELAVDHDAELVFLHVVMREEARHTLPVYDQPLNLAAALAREHERPYVLRLASGFTSDVIQQVADETGAELIVVGASGHGRLRRLLAGSLTARLRRSVHLPLVVVHPAA